MEGPAESRMGIDVRPYAYAGYPSDFKHLRIPSPISRSIIMGFGALSVMVCS